MGTQVVGMSRQLFAVSFACLLLLILPALGAQAVTTRMTDEIEVDGWPDPVQLAPGETTEIMVTVRNTGARTLSIYLDWITCKCPYGHAGSVSESFITLGPGDAMDVMVTVTSGSRFMGDNEGEGMLWLVWGPDLTMVGDSPDDQTVEGDGSIQINVQDDYSMIYMGITVLIVVLIVTVISVIIMVIRNRKADKDLE